MLLTGDLGIQSLVLVISFVIPVISFVIRRKWRLAVARKEEIKRLLILASEEAARAELEASVGYNVVYTVPRYYECPVCYSPATTRCSQCKAVRYCSGKCQIIHWRQGHKEECVPPCPAEKITHSGNCYVQNLSEEDSRETFNDKLEGRRPDKPIEETSEEPAFSKPCSLGSPCKKDDDQMLESFVGEKETNSTSDSSDSSFSGFFSSTSSSNSSNDVNDSTTPIESDRLSGQLSADRSFDILQTTFSAKDSDHSKPVSPKFASLVDSINGFPKLTKANQLKHTRDDGGTQQSICTSSVSNTMFDDQVAELPSGFWGRTLDSPCDDSDASDSYRESRKLPDPQSSLHFSLNLPVSTPLVLHTQGSGDSGCLSEESRPVTHISKATGVSTLSENFGSHLPKIKDSQLLNCEASDNLDDEYRIISDNVKSREVKRIPLGNERISRCEESSKSVNLPTTGTKKPDLLLYDLGRNPNVLKASNIGYSSSSISNSSSATSLKESSVMNLKIAKDNAARTGVGISSQVSNYPNAKNGLKTSVGKVVEQIRGPKISKQYPFGVGRYSDKGLFPYELFVKLYNSNKLELRPSGLINCGNSCYANAVLQCLVFTPPLTAYFLQGLHTKACLKKDWCFTCEFESLVSKAKEGRSPLSPIGILSQLQNIGSQLGHGREEDAHEFLRYAIETMQSVCLKEAGINASGTLEEETTMVGLTFGGYLRSKIKCTKCQGKSQRQESMMDLTVEIEGDIATLEEALRKFTSTETLDGENKYHCGRCKSYEKAKKKLTILEAPNILTIALKRFQSGKFGKLNKPIQFPEILDLAPFMSGTSDKSPIYRLYGVVVHLDIMNAAFSGHYVCYVKNSQNKWFKIDDSTVAPVELEKVLTKGAYMLLYARCSPRAPRLLRNRRAMPSCSIIGKIISPKSKPISPNSGIARWLPGSTNFESSHPRLHQLQRILEDDSSSDNSSLISSNSDEGSCSTDSTRDSTSTDDLTDYLFGDPRRGWSSPWQNYSDSDTSSSSSSSPLCSKHSSLADLENYDSVNLQTNGHRTDAAKEENPNWDGLASGRSRQVNVNHEGSVIFLHTYSTEQCRNIGSSSRHRESDCDRLGSFRRSTTEKTVNN